MGKPTATSKKASADNSSATATAQNISISSKSGDELNKSSNVSDTQMQSDDQNSSVSYYDEAGFRVTRFVDRSSQ